MRKDSSRRGDRSLVAAIFEPLARRLLDRLPLRPDDRILDVACGAGVVGREALHRGPAHVTGLDLDDSRLKAGLHAGPVCCGRAEALPFSERSFSVVTCQHGLMFFRSRVLALREAHRVLCGGGRFAATCWHSFEGNPGFLSLNRAVEVHLGPSAAARGSVPFSLAEPESLVREVEGAGFTSVTTASFVLQIRFPSAESFAECFVRSTSLAPYLDGRDHAMPALRRAVGADLSRYSDPDGVSFPAAAYCVVGEKAPGIPRP